MPLRTQRRRFKFPRRYARTYCLKTSCRKMGFTQKASCRPYKNCYRQATTKVKSLRL